MIKKQKLSGFTLIEILLAIYIGILIFLAITSLYFLAQKFYRIGSDRLEIVQNGRVTFDRLTRELRQTQEITTTLPATKSEPDFPPPSEIQFQDGHQTTVVRYYRYYLDGSEFKRQIIVYYFEDEPAVYINWNATDEEGDPPLSLILEEKLVGEYFSTLQFYGTSETNIEATLTKDEISTNFKTKIFGRNTQ